MSTPVLTNRSSIGIPEILNYTAGKIWQIHLWNRSADILSNEAYGLDKYDRPVEADRIMSAEAAVRISGKDKDNVHDQTPDTLGSAPVPVGRLAFRPLHEQSGENAGQAEEEPTKAREFRLTRKRAASLTSNHDSGYDADLSSGGATSATLSTVESVSQVCLCQPEPKIPRPRNAFILFRQHHHARVVAENPGLANPEISKIIGEQWRDTSTPEKNQWKNLAVEEKYRHQQQYPDYKYQPRRGGRKPLSLAPSLTPGSDDYLRCTKCGGRSLIPSAPSTPSFTPRSGETTGVPPPTPYSGSTGSGNSSGGFKPPEYPMDTPYPSHANRLQRPGIPQPSMGPLRMGSLRENPDDDSLTPLTPSDAKRRRFNNVNANATNSHTIASNFHGPITRSIAGRLEGAGAGNDRTQYPMDPPPPRLRQNSGTEPPTPSRTSLPPLQTMAGDSVKAMVMTIPFLNKIKVINRISPVLSPPGPTSPPHPVRGAIIAIEGNDKDAADALFSWLEEFLQKDDEHTIKSFQSHSTPFDSILRPPEDAYMDGTQELERDSKYFIAYLNSIAEWHRRSEEIVAHITSPAPLFLTSQDSQDSQQSTNSRTLVSLTQQHQQPSRIPLALINRYILSLADEAASTIPINDRYAPVDHWQWMATLWRGCVGPDVTVYLKDGCPPEEVQHWGTVEIKSDAATVVVRRERGRQGFDERMLRRLGFEIGEIVRGMGEGSGGNWGRR